MMLSQRQRQVLRALRARPHGGTPREVAADIQQYQERACTRGQAASSLESLCHPISNRDGRAVGANRVALVQAHVNTDPHDRGERRYYTLTGAGRVVATEL